MLLEPMAETSSLKQSGARKTAVQLPGGCLRSTMMKRENQEAGEAQGGD
jgi:hypothetical protein